MALVPFTNDEVRELISHYEAQGRRFETLENKEAFIKQRRLVNLMREVLEHRENARQTDRQSYEMGLEAGAGQLGLLAMAFGSRKVSLTFERE